MMKRSHRLLILLLTLLIIAALFLIQSWMEPSEPAQSAAANFNCKAVKQCLEAGYAWPPKMENCPAQLIPLTARLRAKDGKWGYTIAHDGCIGARTLVAPKYDFAGKFEKNGLAKVSLDGVTSTSEARKAFR